MLDEGGKCGQSAVDVGLGLSGVSGGREQRQREVGGGGREQRTGRRSGRERKSGTAGGGGGILGQGMY